MIQHSHDVAKELSLPGMASDVSAMLRLIPSESGDRVEFVATFPDRAIEDVLGDTAHLGMIDGGLMQLNARLIRVPVAELTRPVSLLVIGLEVQVSVSSTLHAFAVLDPGHLNHRRVAEALVGQESIPVLIAGQTLFVRHEEDAEMVAGDLKHVLGRGIAAYEKNAWVPEHAEAAEAVLRRRFSDASEYWSWAEFKEEGLTLRLPKAGA